MSLCDVESITVMLNDGDRTLVSQVFVDVNGDIVTICDNDFITEVVIVDDEVSI